MTQNSDDDTDTMTLTHSLTVTVVQICTSLCLQRLCHDMMASGRYVWQACEDGNVCILGDHAANSFADPADAQLCSRVVETLQPIQLCTRVAKAPCSHQGQRQHVGNSRDTLSACWTASRSRHCSRKPGAGAMTYCKLLIWAELG